MGGSPVGGAVVLFWKRDWERGRSAVAVTDDKGNFSLNTNDVNGHKELKGALPGYYDVTIDKYPPPAPTDPPSIGALSETQNVLPAKYSRPGSLEARVKEGEPNEFVFNLDADP
jgi:hypothetical protein